MNPTAYTISLLNIVANTALFILKLWAALASGSIALLSEAFNSLTDMASSVAVYVCVRISEKGVDEGHPFGHSRAEPVAGIIIAILAGILGFEVMRASVMRFLSGGEPTVGLWVLSVPIITMVVKSFMAFYFRKWGRAVNSPAIVAASMDSLCDVLVAAAAFIGVAGVWLGYPLLDPLAAFIISIWIIYTGYSIGMQNIDYLMGSAPEPALMERIKAAACSVEGVKSINTVKAHYVGHIIHVEIHIEVPSDLSTYDSHAIGKAVETRLEAISAIQKAFVHIDPV